METPSRKIGRGAARRRFWLAMVGFAMAFVLLPFSYKVERRLETTVHIEGAESQKVERELAQRFQSPYANRLVLVISGLPDPDSAKSAEALDFLTTSLRSVAGVSGAVSSVDWPDPLFTGNNGGALILVGLDPHGETVEALVPKLRAKADWMEGQLRSQYPGLKLQITGETPINFDLRKVSADDVKHAEERAMPVTLLLLLLAFGSIVAAFLPLGVGLLSISMALGAAALMAPHWHLSILVQNLATMLGLGLGIDYALLMVSRFREALCDGCDPGCAADIAAWQAGCTLAISATTVAIGFSALLMVPISELRSIGIAGLLVTVLSVMLCTFVLPWVLGLVGHRINSAKVCLPSRGRKVSKDVAAADERWVRWGSMVTRRPWTALLIAGIPLLMLAFHARKISTGLPDHDSFPEAAESVQALHTLQHMGRSGIVQSLRVIVELPPQTQPMSPTGWLAISRLTAHFQSDPRAQEVLSLPSLSGMAETADAVEQVPEPIRKSFLRSDGHATLLELLPKADVTPSEQIRWVREVRSSDVAAITGVPGAVLRVGGVPGLDADYDSVVKERLPKVVLSVVVGSLLALLIGLRSLFAAVKAILLNLLSVGASFGMLVLVFQEGHGSRLFGLHGPTGTVFPIVPILAFAIVFGLSMDYEVFLVARVLEERRRGLSEQAAVVEGLARTAGLITSAGAIMIAVFTAFTIGSFLVVQMLGFTLAAAVLIDATVVRMVVGPALLQLAGDWNWWPLGLHGAQAVAEKELVP
ncbi:MMPL family transporter [Tunturiibacter gelidoferens]|jgi:putative drug exporter of the RND superfamily|uniref:RND superfamily putative drug exporter n=1 Tax=Tunturiibacter gelidiferens TaxID=3069689 RepID=A0A9X0QEZ5_9BACT|nr:MMPL family transporter [Edaphobacter lichenicola]MBB5329148.1 RND superfamily putative drug exporter [Edaphobacter lichenicola]